MSAKALEMRLRIKRLQREHQVEALPVHIPLAAPVDHPMILEGYVSTTALDLEHVKMRPWAFTWPRPCKDVPLLHKHNRNEVAGTVDELTYDDKGNLTIRATVTHPEARRCGAFSVAAKVVDYTMHDTDGPNFYAVIRRAELTEISLTDKPANPSALVRYRYRPWPHVQFYSQIGEKVGRLVQLVTIIKEHHHGLRQGSA